MSPPSFCLLLLLPIMPLMLQKCGLGTKQQYWLPREQEVGESLGVEPSWYKPTLLHQPLFLHLVLIVDRRLQRRWGGNMTTTHRLCKEVAKTVAEMVSKLGLKVVLVEVEEWASSADRVRIVPEADITLERFLEYREKMRNR